MSTTSRIYLGELEELVLLLVAMFNNEAYGALLVGELNVRAGRDISISAVHAVLHRLEEKGFVKSKMGGASSERGGRQKRLFSITAYGKKAVVEIRDTRNSIWNAMPKLFPS
jgi:DNA-binding PadR family transcriptional regulator